MSTSFAADFSLPAQLSSLRDHDWTRITLGESGDAVWKIVGDDETLFLKSARLYPGSEHPGEIERLRWLSTTPIPSPKVIHAFEADGHGWLLMSALPGRDLTHLTNQPDELVRILAYALRQLHALDPAACPFDRRLDIQLAEGRAKVAAGRVDETDFDTAHAGWTATSVLAWLETHRPNTTDLVVTHGDASLPNVLASEGKFTGVIDIGRLGVSDRWQDLAIACRSIAFNCGEGFVALFLEAYGAEWDAERYAYYCALDELF